MSLLMFAKDDRLWEVSMMEDSRLRWSGEPEDQGPADVERQCAPCLFESVSILARCARKGRLEL